MFVCNFKVNKKVFFKFFIIMISTLTIIIFLLSGFKIFKKTNNIFEDNSDVEFIDINSSNYTDFLKSCHENIDNYVNKNVCITGYVYRMPDFNDNQFVIARTMLYNSNNNAVVVGILCESNSIKKYANYSWIQIKGTIKKGDYHGAIPYVDVSEIINVDTPKEEFVKEPND